MAAAAGTRKLRDLGLARVIECRDPALTTLIAGDRRLGKLSWQCGERHLIIPATAEAKFRKGLHDLGSALRPLDPDPTGTRANDPARLHPRGRPTGLPPSGRRPVRHHRRPLGLQGAEAVLKLRALHTSGDFGTFWRGRPVVGARRCHGRERERC